MPYTIFHVDSERGFRGGERQLTYLAGWLKAHGHRCVIVCRAGDALEREAKARKLETLTLPFFFLSSWDPFSAWKLRKRLLGERGPVIVHAHSGHGAALAWLATRGTQVPRVVHRRVAFPLSGGLTTRLKYASADAVIAITEAVKATLLASGVPAAKITVIPSVIEPDVAARQADIPREGVRQAYSSELGLDWEADWVGCVAALDRSKGIEHLLRAAKLVLARRPRTAFLLAGEGRQRHALERLAFDLDINTKVRFMGQRSDNLQILKAVDVFALPSMMEGMGSVLLEAAACSAPVVATRVGGIPEVVADGENGLLVPPGDAKALADGILKLLEDRGYAAKLAAEGLKRLDRFTLEQLGGSTVKVYDAVARNTP